MPYAANYNITVDRGAVFQEVLTLKDANDEPLDLSAGGLDVEFLGEVRDPFATTPTLTATFTFEDITDGTDGMKAFILPVEETNKLKKNKLYRYDIFARFGDPADNDFVRLLEGELTARINTTPITPV